MVYKTAIQKTHLIIESLCATIFILLIVFIISFIPFKYEFLKVLRQGFLDIDIYDLYYSGRDDPTHRDGNIVLVELASERDSIGKQINIINNQHPSVIGIDAIFERHKNSLQDSILVHAIGNAKNIVLSTRIFNKDSIVKNFFDTNAKRYTSGYTNFFGGPYSVIRNYVPFTECKKEKYYSFTSRIAEVYSPTKFKQLKDRSNNLELINYAGNLEHYTALSLEEMHYYESTGQLSYLFRNKIVLLGFFKKQPPLVLEDLYFSPLNKQPVGKTYPDIYGVVVHANILSMILSQKYASLAPEIVSYVCSYIITFFLLFYILKEHSIRKHPNHLKFLLIQLIVIIIVSYLLLQIYHGFRLKVPLLPIIVSLVICVELFELYKILAVWLHKKWNYQTIFKSKHSI